MSQLPEGFISAISQYDQLAILADSLLQEPEVSIRLNPEKTVCIPLDKEPVPWCRHGYYLSSRPQFTFDPYLHQGQYYVQDASSMALATVLEQLTSDATTVRYFDACAAPGGKTTTALATLPSGSVVVANEYDFKRAEILAENLSKWGNANVVVSRGDTSKLSKLSEYFDIVAVDAPCSGEGMMRKDQQAVNQWSPSLVEQCAGLQREIISNVWEALRPGGYMIYSTCTFNTTENEGNLRWLIETKDAIPVEIDRLRDNKDIIGAIDAQYPAYRFIPGRVRGEGLFLAVVRKPGESRAADVRQKAEKPKPEYREMEKWFSVPMEFIVDNGIVFAVPKSNAAFIKEVSSKLNTILVGVEAAVIKGRDILPTHQLALTTCLNASAFNIADIDYSQAIKYLQRDNISLPDGTPKGIVLLTYKGSPLGFVKNLGNRTNSFLPKPWRILSQSIPLTPHQIL